MTRHDSKPTRPKINRRSGPRAGALAVLAALLLLAVPAAPAQPGSSGYGSGGHGGNYGGDHYDDAATYESGYSYVRNLRGDATLILPDGDREQIQVNQPVLTGDRLWVAPGSMAEVLLSDGNLLRLDGGSEVSFDALAGSPESRDRTTVLRLLVGNVQLAVYGDALGQELPRIDLPNATVYVGEAGLYRLTTDRGDWSQVVTRSGWAEVLTDRGSEVLRSGEEALVEGYRNPRLAVRRAGAYDGLERWGQRLDHQVADQGYYRDYDDRSLRYAAAPLDDHGTWFQVEGRYAWRPHVRAEWRPYHHGRWRYTSIGLTWVSYEPWGWVPYHYGNWDYVPHYGWAWFPGRHFSPARVYWYWGPDHVAWVPWGYYTRHYGRFSGFRFGVYGWAGGDWGIFADWVVCPTRYFGHRHQYRYAHDGRYWKRHYGGHAVPRGLVTTDTRGLTPDRWHRPEEAMRVLRTRPAARGGAGATRTAELPDVTPFVARQPELPTDVVQRVVSVDGTRGPGRGVAVRGIGGGDDRAGADLGGPPVQVVGRHGDDGGGRGNGGDVRRPRPVTGGDGEGGPGRAVGVRTARPGAAGDGDRSRGGGSPGVRGVRPRGVEPGGDGGAGEGVVRGGGRGSSPGSSPRAGAPDRGGPGTTSPRTGTRSDGPRVARPADPGRGADRPERIRPRGPATRDPGGDRGAGDSVGSGERDGEGRSARPPARVQARPQPDRGSPSVGDRSDRERPSAVRPRGSSRGGGDLSSSPRFRTGASPSSPAPSRGGDRPARVQPRRGDGGSAAPTPPPRSERAGPSDEPPARRVLRGARTPRSTPPPAAGAPRGGSSERPRSRVRSPRQDDPRSRSSASGSPSRGSSPRASSPRTGSRPSAGSRAPSRDRSSTSRRAPSRTPPRASSPRTGSRPSAGSRAPSRDRSSTSRRAPSRTAPRASSPRTGSRPSAGSRAPSRDRSSTSRRAPSRTAPRASSPRTGSRSSAGSRARSGGGSRDRSSASSRRSTRSSAGSRSGGSRSSGRSGGRSARSRDDG